MSVAPARRAVCGAQALAPHVISQAQRRLPTSMLGSACHDNVSFILARRSGAPHLRTPLTVTVSALRATGGSDVDQPRRRMRAT